MFVYVFVKCYNIIFSSVFFFFQLLFPTSQAEPSVLLFSDNFFPLVTALEFCPCFEFVSFCSLFVFSAQAIRSSFLRHFAVLVLREMHEGQKPFFSVFSPKLWENLTLRLAKFTRRFLFTRSVCPHLFPFSIYYFSILHQCLSSSNHTEI